MVGRKLLAFVVLLFAVVISAVAIAQQGVAGLDTNVQGWFANPLVFIASITALVKIIRDEYPMIDGRAVVAVFTVVVGVVVGVIGAALSWIIVPPFNTMSFPWSGLGYGLLGGVSAFLGVNLFDLLAQRLAKAKLESINLLKNRAATVPINNKDYPINKYSSTVLKQPDLGNTSGNLGDTNNVEKPVVPPAPVEERK